MHGDLELPPGFRALPLREYRDAFEHARAIAAEEGAGTLVWVGRFDLLELAVVLEPQEPLRLARRAIFAIMNAAGDALAVHCPPEKRLAFSFPDTLLLDGGIIGGVRLAWPADAAEDVAPAWLVAGLMLRLTVAKVRAGPPHQALDSPFQRGTSLEVEGFEMMEPRALIESFTRHLLRQVDSWQNRGMKPIADQFVTRLEVPAGIRIGIDRNGDLQRMRLSQHGAPELEALLPRLVSPQWLDRETGEPWL